MKKSLSIILVVVTIGILSFTACKKDVQTNPPVITKPIEVIPPPPITDNIYPNPCNGTFTIQTNSTDSQTVVMYSLIGQTVFNLIINGTTAIVNNTLTHGVYIVVITNHTGVVKKKLIVQ
ncbi:MAG TPA: T9SS type A sorting domain-containing protein [Bacteroidia bacterium]|nr:T9SS type A sorting domain-containing protein [Bacteroidia bacterium]